MKYKVLLIGLMLAASLFSAESTKNKLILNVLLDNGYSYDKPVPIYFLGYSFGKVDILAGYST